MNEAERRMEIAYQALVRIAFGRYEESPPLRRKALAIAGEALRLIAESKRIEAEARRICAEREARTIPPSTIHIDLEDNRGRG